MKLKMFINLSKCYINFELYEDALASLPNPDPPREFQGRNNKFILGQPKYPYLENINRTRILLAIMLIFICKKK